MIPARENAAQFLRYVAVGVVMTLLGYAAIFFCMYVLRWSPVASNLTVYCVAIFCSYVLNRRFTFSSTDAWRPELLRFLGVFALAYLANLAALVLLIRAGVHEAASQVLAGVFYVGVSFTANKLHVFRV